MKKIMKTMTVATAIALVTLATGCSSNPVWAQLGQTLLGDLSNGTVIGVLETVIAAAFPAIAAELPSVDAVLQAFISLFESLGLIPTPAQPNVNAIKMQLVERAAAAKKAGYVMSPETQRIVERVLLGQVDGRTVARVHATLVGTY
jgi:hypothetical protein